jgi:hypothetical protein
MIPQKEANFFLFKYLRKKNLLSILQPQTSALAIFLEIHAYRYLLIFPGKTCIRPGNMFPPEAEIFRLKPENNK